MAENKNESKIYYLSPDGKDRWVIIKQGGIKPSFYFSTKQEGLEKAREFAKKHDISIIIRGKNGQIMDSISYKKNSTGKAIKKMLNEKKTVKK